MAKLKTLEVKALRGIRDTELLVDGKNILLWGENGSGKSSIVDALEFLFKGTISPLAGTQGISLQRHGPHLDFNESDMTVTGVFDPGAVSVTRTLATTSDIPATVLELWSDCQRTNFLRRAQLLDFIHAEPRNRFSAIGSLIGQNGLDEVELAFMAVRDKFLGRRDSEKGEVERIRVRLGQIVGSPYANPSEVLVELNVSAEDANLQLIPSVSEISNTAEVWLRSTKKQDQEKINELTQLKAKTSSFAEVAQLKASLQRYNTAYETLAAEKQLMERLSESEFLRSGELLLQSRQWNHCPLCSQSFDQAATLKDVQERRTLLLQLSEEFADFRKLCAELAAALVSIATKIGELQSAVPESQNAAAQRTTLLNAEETIRKVAEAVGDSTKLQTKADVQAFEKNTVALNDVASILAASVSIELDAFALTEADRTVLNLIERAQGLQTLGVEFNQRSEDLKKFEELNCRGQHAFNAFSASKKEEVASVYKDIESDVRRFYESLHPGEAHEGFELKLVEGRRASTTLQINAFGRQQVDPRALTSEGHLDSLGLCIFLAFVKNFASASKFLVLDDVIMSIDSSHRGRVAELLLSEFKDWQMILTTHDEIWFDEFIRHEQAFGVDGNFQNLRITRWNLTEGPVFRPQRGRWDRIEDRLNEADKQGSANLGRQFLEWTLEEICINTMAQVVIKRRRDYDAGDLFDPARVRLQRLIPGDKAQVEMIFQEIKASATPGNLLSHNNANANAISIDEIRRFCQSTKALQDWFMCPSCQQFPVYTQSIKLLKCPNQRCGNPKELKTS